MKKDKKHKQVPTLARLSTPQLELIHKGKVRDSFRVDASSRLIFASDRVSAFDFVMGSTIPAKGAVLNSVSAFWFEKTKHIIGNHLISAVDPSVSLVKEAEPLRVEMVVRGYLTGSMWRAYAKGKRTFSGMTVPDGLTQNQRFPEPIVTPTTKGEKDEEISPEEIIKTGLVDKDVYRKIEKASLELFRFGTEYCAGRGLILVDTKYEFGLLDGKPILIDEIHTPDSSRYWHQEDYDRDPIKIEARDKEYLRKWLLENTDGNVKGLILPDEVIAETSRRYLAVFEEITGYPLETGNLHPADRVTANLVSAGIIRDGYVAIVMGSAADKDHALKIRASLESYKLAVPLRVVSAHKNGEDIGELADELNNAPEPGCVIAIAGLSNGLGGALAANLALPVFSCPPGSDNQELALQAASSLFLPSATPAGTVLNPKNAAALAARCLNLPRLKENFRAEIASVKEKLRADNRKMREEYRV